MQQKYEKAVGVKKTNKKNIFILQKQKTTDNLRICLELKACTILLVTPRILYPLKTIGGFSVKQSKNILRFTIDESIKNLKTITIHYVTQKCQH